MFIYRKEKEKKNIVAVMDYKHCRNRGNNIDRLKKKEDFSCSFLSAHWRFSVFFSKRKKILFFFYYKVYITVMLIENGVD